MVLSKSNWRWLSYGNTAHSLLSAHFLCKTWIWWGFFKVGDLGSSFYWGASQDNLVWLWNLISHYSSSWGFHPSQAHLLIYSPNLNRLTAQILSPYVCVCCSLQSLYPFFSPVLRSYSPSRPKPGCFCKAVSKPFQLSSFPCISPLWISSLAVTVYVIYSHS